MRRGLGNVAIQSYLTAAAMNFKKLAAHAAPYRIWTIVNVFRKQIMSNPLQFALHAA